MNDDTELRLFEQVKQKYHTLLDEFEKDEALLRGDYGSDIIPDDTEDAGLEVIKPPTAYNAIENLSDHVLASPRILVPSRPVGPDGGGDRESARKRQRILEYAWQRFFQDDGDPLGRGKKSCVKGKMVLKKVTDWDVLPDRDDARFKREVSITSREQMLWHLEVIPKETVYEDPDHPWDPRFVFESYDISIMEARERFGDIEGLESKDSLERVPYLEMWTRPKGKSRGKFIQWVNDKRVHDEFNPYSWETLKSTAAKPDWTGYIPYAICDPGWGDSDAKAKPEDRYVSLTRPMRSMCVAEARMLTEAEAFFRLYVWPVLKSRNLPADKELKLHPGAHWDLTGDQEIDILQFGELPSSLMAFISRINQYADEASKFGVLGGQPQRGVDTATEADAHIKNAAVKLSGVVRGIRRAVQMVNTWLLMDVEHVFEAPVTVWAASGYETLTPDDVKGAYYTQVELETSDEATISMRQLRLFSDLKARGAQIPWAFILEQGGIDDVEGVMAENEVELLAQSPQALQIKTMKLLANLGSEFEIVKQAYERSIVMGNAKESPPNPSGGSNPGDTGDNAAIQTMELARADAMAAAPERQTM